MFFVVIVGRGRDESGNFFIFYGNGTVFGAYDENKFRLKGNNTLSGVTNWGNQTLKVTFVQPSQKKKNE